MSWSGPSLPTEPCTDNRARRAAIEFYPFDSATDPLMRGRTMDSPRVQSRSQAYDSKGLFAVSGANDSANNVTPSATQT